MWALINEMEALELERKISKLRHIRYIMRRGEEKTQQMQLQ
jgi:hypothetical protein